MAITVTQKSIVVAAEEAGERLDRVLAAPCRRLSRSRLKALILAGAVALGGRTIRDPSHRVNAGDAIVVEVPPPAAGRARAGAHPARASSTRTTTSSSSTSPQPGGASRRRQLDRHPGQCADRPLRRQPLRHRRGAPARHRAPARQGHHRRSWWWPRPTAPTARWRRNSPITAAPRAVQARLPGLRLGRAGPAQGHHRQADRPPPPGPRPHGRARGGRAAVTHWQVLERYSGKPAPAATARPEA